MLRSLITEHLLNLAQLATFPSGFDVAGAAGKSLRRALLRDF
jgi:hypothetical protein